MNALFALAILLSPVVFFALVSTIGYWMVEFAEWLDERRNGLGSGR